jgi:hypothetical protein
MGKIDRTITKATVLVSNKQARSVFFLLLTFLFILGINSLLPLIEGGTQYTVEVRNLPYTQYRMLTKPENEGVELFLGNQTYIGSDKYRLTWKSENDINNALRAYDPEIHGEYVDYADSLVIKGNVFFYTKFFYESSAWYVSTGVSMLSTVLLFYALFNYLIVRAKERYERYVDLSKQIQVIVETLLNPDVFEPWMDHTFNKRRKIQQHTANVKVKLDRLERRTPYKIKQFFRDTPGFKLKNLTFRQRRYYLKRERLKSMLNDDYINDYVINGRVKHFVYVHPMFIYNGINGSGYAVDSYSNLKSDAKRISKDALQKILLSLVLAITFAALLTFTISGATGQGVLWIIISIIVKITPLLLQVPLAIDYSNSFMEEQLMNNLIARRAISYQFLGETTGKDTRAVRKIVEEVEDNEQN